MPIELRLPFDEPAEPAGLAGDRAAREAAVDPRRNIVLEASAGTGKTRVLVDRYVNLVEAGIDPANILAITFTRKAAAEMRERIVARLRGASGLSDAHRSRWRALQERLGEVAISTIDAFCLGLLREFPLEADLDPGFEVADETETRRLIGEAVDETLSLAQRLAARRAEVALVLGQLDERGLADGLAALVANRLASGRMLRRFLRAGTDPVSVEAAAGTLAARLCASLAHKTGGLETFLRDAPVWHPAFALVAGELRLLCASAGAVPPWDAARLRALLDDVSRHFLTEAGTPRDRLRSPYLAASFPSRQAYERHRDDVRRLAPDVAAMRAAFRRDLNRVAVAGVWRLFRIAEAQYRQRLEAAAVVDFTEMLARALQLLGRMDEFSQSRYRLEARYHHLLLDEFQDTSAAQWRLVSLLVRSWGEGQGLAYEGLLPPSVFVVGDRKQSIYGFRDADVTILRRARREIARLRPGSPVRRSLTRSFRAVPALLAFTNDFFSAVEQVAGRRDRFRFGPRDRFPVGDPGPAGEVAIGVSAADAVEAAARTVTAEIERLLSSATVRDRGTGLARGARPDDIAILFRSRESHREFAAALDERRIPSYVYKGLGFFDADEVRDLAALVRYLADPASDLRAAAFLRTRFVRLSDAGLQQIGPHLACALTDQPSPSRPAGMLSAEDRQVLDRVRQALGTWLPLVDRVPPAALLDRILTESAYAWETRGLRHVQARENLKKMRAIVRRIQNRGYATFDRIAERLDQLSAGDESNAIVDAANAVNLMTIHAAKGLEFPIVFLVNVTRGAGGRRPPVRVASTAVAAATVAEAGVSVGDFVSEEDEDVRARDREETKRLLYVAVTRARERLYFSAIFREGWRRRASGSLGEVFPPSFLALLGEAWGTEGPRVLEWVAPGGSIHRVRVIESAAPAGPPGSTAPESEAGAGPAERPGGPQLARISTGRAEIAGSPDRFERLPDTAAFPRLPVTAIGQLARIGGLAEPRPDPGQEPAAAAAGSGADAGRVDDGAEARLAGTLVHRLFQRRASLTMLDDAGLAARVRSAARPDELAAAADEGALVESVVGAFRRLCTQPDLLAVLEGGTPLYEVPFSVRTGAAILRGTIDCLVRTSSGEVIVVEIKTGRPRTWHRQQLQLYVDAVRQALPGIRVSAEIFYADA